MISLQHGLLTLDPDNLYFLKEQKTWKFYSTLKNSSTVNSTNLPKALEIPRTLLHRLWTCSFLSELSSVSVTDFALDVLEWQEKWLPRREREKEKLSSSSEHSSTPLSLRLYKGFTNFLNRILKENYKKKWLDLKSTLN